MTCIFNFFWKCVKPLEWSHVGNITPPPIRTGATSSPTWWIDLFRWIFQQQTSQRSEFQPLTSNLWDSSAAVKGPAGMRILSVAPSHCIEAAAFTPLGGVKAPKCCFHCFSSQRCSSSLNTYESWPSPVRSRGAGGSFQAISQTDV